MHEGRAFPLPSLELAAGTGNAAFNTLAQRCAGYIASGRYLKLKPRTSDDVYRVTPEENDLWLLAVTLFVSGVYAPRWTIRCFDRRATFVSPRAFRSFTHPLSFTLPASQDGDGDPGVPDGPKFDPPNSQQAELW